LVSGSRKRKNNNNERTTEQKTPIMLSNAPRLLHPPHSALFPNKAMEEPWTVVVLLAANNGPKALSNLFDVKVPREQ
jgi:hypothetical protein